MRNIGIIGAGAVGGTVGRAWAHLGYDVFFAARNPASERMQTLLKECGPNARAGDVAAAADFADTLLLATPWRSTRDAIDAAGDLAGKIVIDATNPLTDDLSGLDFMGYASGGEAVADWAKGARVVKGLNQIGAELMDAPLVKAGRPVMFIAGDDEDAKKDAAGLIEQLGFEVDDCGRLAVAQHLEHLAMLWILRAMVQGKGASFALVLSDAAPPDRD